MAILVRSWNVADEFTALMTHRAINESKQQIQGFADFFGELIKKVIAQENKVVTVKPTENSASAIIKFTVQEIAHMDTNFQKEIKATGRVARVIKTLKNGEIMYEIRYRRNGYNLSVSSPNLIEAKQKFIRETKMKNI